MPKPLIRLVTLLLLPMVLVGCGRWQAQLEGPRDVLSDPEVRHVRLTRTNSEQVEMRIAEIQGDSIYGSLGGSGPVACVEAGSLCNARVAISEVGFVEVRKFSLVRTLAAVAVPLGAIALLLVVDGPCSPLDGPC